MPWYARISLIVWFSQNYLGQLRIHTSRLVTGILVYPTILGHFSLCMCTQIVVFNLTYPFETVLYRLVIVGIHASSYQLMSSINSILHFYTIIITSVYCNYPLVVQQYI